MYIIYKYKLYMIVLIWYRVYILGWSEGAVVQILYAFVGPREGDGVGASEAGSSWGSTEGAEQSGRVGFVLCSEICFNIRVFGGPDGCVKSESFGTISLFEIELYACLFILDLLMSPTKTTWPLTTDLSSSKSPGFRGPSSWRAEPGSFFPWGGIRYDGVLMKDW